MAHVIASLLAVMAMVEVDGTATCPSPASVASRLGALVPQLGAAKGAPDRVWVEVVGRKLSIELRRPSGALVASRRVDMSGSCAELANAVAVMIAIWEAELRAGTLSVPKLPPETHAQPPAPAPVVIAPRPRPVTEAPPAAVIAQVPSPRRSAPDISSPAAPDVQITARPRRGLDWEVGAGFLGSIAGGAFAPGGAAECLLGWRASPLMARTSLAFAGRHSQPLGPGRVEFERVTLSLGASYRFLSGQLTLDAHADALAAVLRMSGVGFTTTRQELDFDPGLGAGLRLALRTGRLLPWIGAQTTGWLRSQELRVRGITETATLPRIELWLTAGASFAFGK